LGFSASGGPTYYKLNYSLKKSDKSHLPICCYLFHELLKKLKIKTEKNAQHKLINLNGFKDFFHLHHRIIVVNPLAGVIQTVADEGGVFIFYLPAIMDMAADRIFHGVF
jgi:hypothetical protein